MSDHYQHSPEPWRWSEFELRDGDGKPIPFYGVCREPIKRAQANARRAKECVNACAGMEDPANEIVRMRSLLRRIHYNNKRGLPNGVAEEIENILGRFPRLPPSYPLIVFDEDERGDDE